MELLATLPETRKRVQGEVELLIALGVALRATKGQGAPEVAQTYTRARQLCHHLDDPHYLFPTLRGLWNCSHVRAELQTAQVLGEQLLTLAQQGKGDSSVSFGRISVDLARRHVTRGDEELHLTPIEYKLLAYLIANPDVVITHRQLLKNIWGPSHSEDSHYVRVYMGQLRKKIEDDPSQPRHIRTETGVGYRFVMA